MTQLPLSPTITTDLQEVERIVRERTRSRAAVISVAGPHLLQPGEERLRAALVLLAAHAGSYQLERVLHAAAAVELIYAATRTHDDLVDEAERRRGQAATGDWNHGVGLMVGDYLFALAAGEMALSPDPRVIGYYSQAVMQICESELAPVAALRPLEQARTQYFERVGGTAAALYAAACRAGAACGGASSEQIDQLGLFGHELGLALRLGDELNDFDHVPTNGAVLPGASLRRGAVTLPLLLAASAGDGERLEHTIEAGDPAELDWAVAEVQRFGLEPARVELRRRADAARTQLASFPAGEACTTLEQIVDYAAARAG